MGQLLVALKDHIITQPIKVGVIKITPIFKNKIGVKGKEANK